MEGTCSVVQGTFCMPKVPGSISGAGKVPAMRLENLLLGVENTELNGADIWLSIRLMSYVPAMHSLV